MPRAYLIFLFSLLCLHHAMAQFDYERDRRDIGITASYLGVLDLASEQGTLRHGAEVGISWAVLQKSKVKQQRKTKINRIVNRDLFLTGNLSTYKREDLHQALVVSTGPSFRITLPEGLFFEFEGRIGYMHTFLKGNKYRFENNEISATALIGNNLISLHANGRIGWDFYKSHEYPVMLFSSVGLMTYFPNNEKWLLQPVLQAGLGFILVRLKDEYSE